MWNYRSRAATGTQSTETLGIVCLETTLKFVIAQPQLFHNDG